MKKALLVIDVQNGMFQQGNAVHNGEEFLQNLKGLITRAHFTNTPVIYVQHNEPVGEPLEYGAKDWGIHPEIAPQKHDVIIHKTTPDSFFNTSLNNELKKQAVEHLIVAGIQTEVCVDTTCRKAFSMEYKVTLASDTHTTWDSEELTAQQIIQHHNSLLRWFADVSLCNDIEL